MQNYAQLSVPTGSELMSLFSFSGGSRLRCSVQASRYSATEFRSSWGIPRCSQANYEIQSVQQVLDFHCKGLRHLRLSIFACYIPDCHCTWREDVAILGNHLTLHDFICRHHPQAWLQRLGNITLIYCRQGTLLLKGVHFYYLVLVSSNKLNLSQTLFGV